MSLVLILSLDGSIHLLHVHQCLSENQAIWSPASIWETHSKHISNMNYFSEFSRYGIWGALVLMSNFVFLFYFVCPEYSMFRGYIRVKMIESLAFCMTSHIFLPILRYPSVLVVNALFVIRFTNSEYHIGILNFSHLSFNIL